MRCPYSVLGIKDSSTKEEAKSAWRTLVQKYHPDVNSTDEAARRIREVNDAYDQIKTGKAPPRLKNSAQRNPFQGRRRGFQRRPPPPPPPKILLDLKVSLPSIMDKQTVRIPYRHMGGFFEIVVPMGIHSGQILRGVRDVDVRVWVDTHKVYQRKGNHLYRYLDLFPEDLQKGCDYQIETLNGKQVKVNIPPGTENGKVFRLKGLGAPTGTFRLETYGAFPVYGDMFCTVRTVTAP